jgi:pimeloyl-ACP methyl ester carboxylesterase
MAIFVVIHGGWTGGWCWRDVRLRLSAAGHEVYTPTLTGLGERIHLAQLGISLETHILDVVNVLEYEDLWEVVLVGHSYGGMVITGVAERVPHRIARLVYLDAFVPQDGEAQLDLLPPPARAALEQLFASSPDGWRVPPLPGSGPRLLQHPWRCFTEPLAVCNLQAASLPRIYVRCTADKAAGEFMEQSFARSVARACAAGWPVLEIATGHSISADPQPKAEALLEIVSR